MQGIIEMSGSSGLSGRYAKALYELAKDNKTIPNIVKDFEVFKNLIDLPFKNPLIILIFIYNFPSNITPIKSVFPI